LADGFVDDTLDFIRIGIGVARPDVLDGAVKHAPPDCILNELGEVAFFGALGTQKGAQGKVGLFSRP
jgi:hypothetical protein